MAKNVSWDGSSVGKFFMVFIGVILVTILIPIVADSASYQTGEANDNQVYSFIADATSNFSNGHYGVTSANVTANNLSYYSFDDVGTADYMVSTAIIPLGTEPAQNWSLVANIFIPSTMAADKNYSIFTKVADGTNPEMIIGIDGTNRIFLLTDSTKTECLIYSGIYTNATGTAEGNITDRFVQLGVTFGVYQDVDSTSSNATFYLDGVKINTTVDVLQDALACGTNWTDGAVRFGNSTSWGAFNNGSIDYVRIYNETINDANMTLQVTTRQTFGLYREWKFNDGSGTTARENIAAANGVLVGGTWVSDGIISTVTATYYTVTDGTIVLSATGLDKATGYVNEALTWTYNYDNRVGMGSGVSTVIALIEILLAIGLLLFVYWSFKDNIEGMN